jgi:hypothetical protein
MLNESNNDNEPDVPMVYEIRLKGHLGCQWTAWFEGLAITLEANGETRLTGPVADQAGLHGLLKKVRDIGMPLLAVRCVQSGGAERSDPISVHQGERNEHL